MQPISSHIFFDTEFTELSQQAELISLGIVSASGGEFYAKFTDFDKNRRND